MTPPPKSNIPTPRSDAIGGPRTIRETQILKEFRQLERELSLAQQEIEHLNKHMPSNGAWQSAIEQELALAQQRISELEKVEARWCFLATSRLNPFYHYRHTTDSLEKVIDDLMTTPQPKEPTNKDVTAITQAMRKEV